MRSISSGKCIAAGILLLPTAEIGVFLLVAGRIGLPGAFFLLLATSLLGIAILGHVGRVVIRRFARLVQEGNATAVEVGKGGLATVLGGLLLVVPGFITDLIGLVLIVPPVRRLLLARLFRERPRPGAPAMIDLEPEEWRRVPPPRLKSRRKKPPQV